MPSYLVIIYGAPLSGKSSVAWHLAKRLPGKAAVVSADQLLDGSIARQDEDAAAELDMVHTQLRLLVANYMKNGYHVVVEGPFYYQRSERLHRYEQDIDQLEALMRQMTRKALLVRLTAAESVLHSRAQEAGRDPALCSIDAQYKPRYGPRSQTFDTGQMGADEIAEAIRGRLLAEEFA